jgi:hypothetical protein
MKRIYCIILILVSGIDSVNAQWDSIGYINPTTFFTSPLVSYLYTNVAGGTPSNPWEYGYLYKIVNDEGTRIFQTGSEFPYVFGSILSFNFRNNDTGFVGFTYMNEANLVRTTDGGSSWDLITEYFGDNIIYSFLRTDYGYYFRPDLPTSDTTKGLTLFDNGLHSIQDSTFLDSLDVKSILFINDSTGFTLCGRFGYTMFRTFDFGKTWNETEYPLNKLKKIFFPGNERGFLLDTANFLYSSTDLGATWSLIDSIPMEHVLDFYFLNPDTGWAAGSHGNIMKTTTGGMQWEIVQSPTINDIVQIRFFSPDVGYMITRYCQYTNYCDYQLYRTHSGPWGVGEKEATRPIRIIENPVRTKLRLTATTSSELISPVEIISTYGKVVYHSDNYSAEIDVSSLPAGLYFLRYSTNLTSYVLKFIVTEY